MLVYKLTSPSGKLYIGKTSKTLEERIRTHARDRQRLINKGKPLPRFYSAWSKYPIDQWIKEVVSEGTSDEVNLFEQVMIEHYQTRNPDYGYNMARGGDGGDTGRNHEDQKRKRHSQYLKERFKSNPTLRKQSTKAAHQFLKNNPDKLLEKRKKMSQSMPHGKNHHKHSGLWVVNHNVYESSLIAALKEPVSIDIIQIWCNAPDKIIKPYRGKVSAGIEGTTRRESGFYRIKENNNG